MLDKQKQLFRIIFTLVPSEKSYFKKYCYKNATKYNEILSLFDIIEKVLKKIDDIEKLVEENIVKLFKKKILQRTILKRNLNYSFCF